MQLNITTDHAIRMILILAKRNKIASSIELSRVLSVTQRYLLSVGAKLRDAGYVQLHMAQLADTGYLKARRI